MAGELYAIAGSKLFIGDRVSGKSNVTAADFANANWVEIDGWTSAGQVGDTQEVGEQAMIKDRRVRKYKTTLNAGNMENQFVPMALDAGQKKFKQAIEDCAPYQFKVEWGADCVPTSTVTITVATPGVVTWNNHGLAAGQPVVFTTTGALPTGLTAGTVYYVVAGGLTANSFSVAATAGGTAIDTTGAGSGTHTASAPPVGMTDMFYGLAMPGARSGGEADALNMRTWSIAIDSNIVEV